MLYHTIRLSTCSSNLFCLESRSEQRIVPTSWPSEFDLLFNTVMGSPFTDLKCYRVYRMPRWLSSAKMEVVKCENEADILIKV